MYIVPVMRMPSFTIWICLIVLYFNIGETTLKMIRMTLFQQGLHYYYRMEVVLVQVMSQRLSEQELTL